MTCDVILIPKKEYAYSFEGKRKKLTSGHAIRTASNAVLRPITHGSERAGPKSSIWIHRKKRGIELVRGTKGFADIFQRIRITDIAVNKKNVL